MKKFIFQSVAILTISSQLAVLPVFSLSISTLEAAEMLADKGIITKRYDAKAYQLQSPINRQEAVAIIGKSSGAVSGDDSNYNCRRIFNDVSEGWVCRSVELSTDAGIISKNNSQFRPKDKVSYFEAAIMALKGSCLNPNHALSGNTDQERIIERAREAGINIDKTIQRKPITRGEFFRFMTLAKDFTENHPNQIDVAMPACIRFENFSIGNLSLNIPTNWNKVEENPNSFYFDEKQVGVMRLYVRSYSTDVSPGVFYENTRTNFNSNDQGKILKETNGSIAGSKVFQHNFISDETELAQNYTNIIVANGNVYEIIFAYSPNHFSTYESLFGKIFNSIRISNNSSANNTITNNNIISVGDVAYINYKKTSDSGRISYSGDSILTIGDKNNTVPKVLENAIKTLKIGEKKTVRIEAKDSYGELYSEEKMTHIEFESFKNQNLLGNIITRTKNALIGKETSEIPKSIAMAQFGSLFIGKQILEGNVTLKITSINGDMVTIESNNPNAIFYGKSFVIGDKVMVEGGTEFTVQSINNENISIVMKVGYTILSQDSEGVTVKVRNTHPFSGENLTYEITLIKIEKAN